MPVFPLPPFNAIVCPVNTAPLVGNAEVVRVTAVAGDTFTIVRTQEGSNARAIQAGDQIYAAITAKTLTDAEALTPIGSIQMFGGASAPVNFLICDGTQYLNSDYPALAAVLGTSYGGDATHFNVPDMKGRVPMGAGTGTGLAARARGDKPGVEVYALALGEMPAHDHGGSTAGGDGTGHGAGTTSAQNQLHTHSGTTGGETGHTHGTNMGHVQGTFNVGSQFTTVGAGSDSTGGSSGHVHGFSTGTESVWHWHGLASNGSGNAHQNIQPSSVLNYIIRAR